MSVKDIRDFLETLRASGADSWTILFGIFGVTAIVTGHRYVKVLLGYFNKRHQIQGDLDRKLQKLDVDLQAKRDKLAKRAPKNKDKS